MADEQSIKINLELATQAAQIALKEFTKQTKEADNFWNIFKGNLAANFTFAGIKKAASAVRDFATEAVDAAIESEAALNKMTVALAQSGIVSQRSIKLLADYAEELQNTTQYSEEAAQASISLLGSLTKLDADGIKQATGAAADLAATLGIDLESATQLIIKGINGQTGAFSKLGIEVKKGKTEAESFSNVMQALSKFQGAAEKTSQTFAGSLNNLNDARSELMEGLGALITQNPLVIAGMQKLTEVVNGLANFFKKNSDDIILFANSMLTATAAVGGLYLGFLALTGGLVGLSTALGAVSTAATIAWAAITGPIGLAITGVIALGGAMFVIVKYWDQIKVAAYEAIAATIEFGAKAAEVFSPKTAEAMRKEAEAFRLKAFATKEAAFASQELAKQQELQAQRDEENAKNTKKRNSEVLESYKKLADDLIKFEMDKNKRAEDALKLRQERDAIELEETKTKFENGLVSYREYQTQRDMVDAEFEANRADLAATKRESDLAAITAARNADLISQQEFNLARKGVEDQYSSTVEKNEIDRLKRSQKNKKDDAEMDKKIAADRLKNTNSFFNDLRTIAGDGAAGILEVQRAYNYAEAGIAGVTAIQKAASALPYPANIPGIVVETVRMAASLARIKAMGPSFATGGIVGGASGASLGPDNTTANVRTGEMILNARQQRNLFDSIDSGSGGGLVAAVNNLANVIMSQPIVVNVGGKTVVETIRSELDSGRVFA